MNSKFFILLLSITVLFFVSCTKGDGEKKAATVPEIKRGVQPVADNEIAVIEMQQPAYGTIKLELYSNIAPKMVARFKELAREGVYNGTTFHRIDQNLGIIQGGDPFSKDDNPLNDGQGNSGKPNVPAEFSDIPYDTGILGAARTQEPNSANVQFFITLKRQQAFDTRYTVFGKVIEGMSNVRTISGVQPLERERPVENVVIKSITIESKH